MNKHFVRALAIAALALGALLVPATAGAVAPSNDDFANARVIDPSSLPFNDVVDVTDATVEPGDGHGCPFFGQSQTLWWSITPSSSGALRVGTIGSLNYEFAAIYQQTGSGPGDLSLLACGDWYFGSTAVANVKAGETYYIQAGTSFAGSGTVGVSVQFVPPPANDAFADATAIGALPFSDVVDGTAATNETNEPTPSCGSMDGTIWYAFAPSTSGSYTASLPYTGFYTEVAVYTGAGLGSLNEIGCRPYYQPLTFHADAGLTYYVQVGGSGGTHGTLRLQLDVAQPPSASFSYGPGDPSVYDNVQFYDQSYDPGGNGFTSELWHFGDGGTASNPGCCPTHKYAKDGDYTVQLDVTTSDGRTASSQQVVHVRTHDVSIAKIIVPQTARVGQSRVISVGLTNARYAETVQVQLLKSVAGGGWQQVGVLTQYVPVRGGNRTTDFNFNYTFAPEDAALGKINFQAVATIQSARDAIPTDDTFISMPTKVTK